MKICEAFRTEWESIFQPKNDWKLSDDRNELHCRKQRGKDHESEWAHFLAWHESCCYYLTKGMLKQYDIDLHQIEQAKAVGFMEERNYNNAAVRAGRIPATQYHLTAAGRKALFKAYPTWKLTQ